MVDFTKEQIDFLDSEGRVVLCACPGSGKTFLVATKLMKYIVDWNLPHQGVAVLSFTNVASNEIAIQSEKLMYQGYKVDYPHFIGTLDSFINRYILLRFGYLLFNEKIITPKIIFEDYYDTEEGYWRAECRRKCVSNLHNFKWKYIDDTMILINNDGQPVNCSPNRWRKHPPCYEFKKIQFNKGKIFQNEVPSFAIFLLKKYPEIAKSIAKRFPVIIVDEAQDTSEEQMEILDIIESSGVETMCLVGDPDQAIYEWRNATPECFERKMQDKRWNTIYFTHNFRNSQHICNATKYFAKSLEGKQPNIASGATKHFPIKPILLLYRNTNSEDEIIEYFLKTCEENSIGVDDSTLSVLTRGRIYENTDIKGLWKSSAVENFAKSTCEWFHGSRKKAYDYAEKAFYELMIDDLYNANERLESKILESFSVEDWKSWIIQILNSYDSTEVKIKDWVSNIKSDLKQIAKINGFSYRSKKIVDERIKIKSSDKRFPNFKDEPLYRFMEKKSKRKITLSSVHGVKGETYDATLLLVNKTKGNTLTPNYLENGPLNEELMRIAYVAMTRPRKILMVAMPYQDKEFKRFSKKLWEYVVL